VRCARLQESPDFLLVPLKTVTPMIRFVFSSEQLDCSLATAYSEMIPCR
jgi:hypothetical protein